MTMLEESLLGRLAVSRGYLDDEQLESCVFEQFERNWKGARIRIGEILKTHGYIDEIIINELLKVQREQSTGQFGEVAVRLAMVSPDEVEHVLAVQEEQKNRGRDPEHIGQLMKKEGFMGDDDVAEVLYTQQRKARLCAQCGHRMSVVTTPHDRVKPVPCSACGAEIHWRPQSF